MKIILLRHEKRYENVGFFSELTDEGKMNAETIVINKISEYENKYGIDIIFCSPFLRTIQTIYPYCNLKKKKINIEYSLVEYLHNPYFVDNEWYYTFNDIKDPCYNSIINKDYISLLNKQDFSVLEDEIKLEERVKIFVNSLKKNYSDKTILFITHMSFINKMKDLYLEKTKLSDNFPMGNSIIIDIR